MQYEETVAPFILEILVNLFTAEYRRLQKELTKLNQRNNEAYRYPYDGFYFNGEYFRPEHIMGGKSIKITIHDSLIPDIEFFVKDRKIINEDRLEISQMLYRLLDPCLNHQEMRDALPECIVDTLYILRQYDRTQADGHSLKNDRARRQYKKLLPKIELYSAARLMY